MFSTGTLVLRMFRFDACVFAINKINGLVCHPATCYRIQIHFSREIEDFVETPGTRCTAVAPPVEFAKYWRKCAPRRRLIPRLVDWADWIRDSYIIESACRPFYRLPGTHQWFLEERLNVKTM